MVAKWLEQPTHNIVVPSSNPPGARAPFLFSINSIVCLARSFKRGASLLFFLKKYITLAVLPEAKQA